MIDESKRRTRTGRTPLPADELRTHTVSVRLNPDELAWLDAQREQVKMQRGEYLRVAAMGKLPKTIPALNQEAWSELARAAANLNQIAQKLNANIGVSIDEIREELADFRNSLIGGRR